MSFRNLAACAAIASLAACVNEGPTAVASRATPETPSYNLNGPQFNVEVILRTPGGGGGAEGSVKFRQATGSQLIELGTSVRKLAANSDYYLYRATDAQDGICDGDNWLRLGEGPTPAAISTNGAGSGTADLWRDLTDRVDVGSTFDIRFQVRDDHVVLESGCYQFTSGK
jgi:hypothetical protein